MSRAVRLIRKHGFLPGNGLEALVEEALSANAPDPSERVSRLEEALTKAAATFDAYAAMHFAKVRGATTPAERAAILEKVRRNKDYAAAARSALNDGGSNVGE